MPEFSRRLRAYLEVLGRPAAIEAFAAAGEPVTLHTLRHWLRHPPRPITQRGILGILADAARPADLPPPANIAVPETAAFAEAVDRHVARLGGIRATLAALRAGGEPLTRRALEKYRKGEDSLRPAIQRGILAILADAPTPAPLPVPAGVQAPAVIDVE